MCANRSANTVNTHVSLRHIPFLAGYLKTNTVLNSIVMIRVAPGEEWGAQALEVKMELVRV
jgi:hypothetical protein